MLIEVLKPARMSDERASKKTLFAGVLGQPHGFILPQITFNESLPVQIRVGHDILVADIDLTHAFFRCGLNDVSIAASSNKEPPRLRHALLVPPRNLNLPHRRVLKKWTLVLLKPELSLQYDSMFVHDFLCTNVVGEAEKGRLRGAQAVVSPAATSGKSQKARV